MSVLGDVPADLRQVLLAIVDPDVTDSADVGLRI